jgi:CRISPR-associated protein Cmr6
VKSPISACRDVLKGVTGGEHAGLLLDCYLSETNDEGDERRRLFGLAAEATKAAAPIYRAAFERWERDVKPTAQKRVRVDGRLIVGLGSGSVLETSITLHHTYGVPLIPGCALKGLASAFCHREWGARYPTFQVKDDSRIHRTLFGTNDESGCVVFHDAWIAPESLEGGEALKLDVMTPHHGSYYLRGGAENPPADTDAPIPVTFLSVTGEFRLALSVAAGGSEEQSQWGSLAMELLIQAVSEWGVGGKTSAGYGRMYELDGGRVGPRI